MPVESISYRKGESYVECKALLRSANDWNSNDYYSLHRLVTHADRKKDEISQLDVQRMSDKTKVLLYCIISYYHLDKLFELSNLQKLTECQPLSEPLVLSDHGLRKENIYYKMNVMF